MKIKLLFLLIVLAKFAATQIRSADASSYGVLKGQSYLQSAAGAPALSPTQPYKFLSFVTVSDTGQVDAASVRTPAGNTLQLQIDTTSFTTLRYVSTDSASSSSTLSAKYGSGTYSFNITGAADGTKTANVTLGADNYPVSPPVIANLSAAQSIDASADFTLTWSSFAGAGVNDRIQLTIVDSNGLEVFSTPDITRADALGGAATSVTIPAGSLSDTGTFAGHLTFAKLGQKDTTTYPGAIGIAGFSSDTAFVLRTGGTTGGVPDTTPPTLVLTSPQSGTTGVPTQTPVVFSFSEPMAASESIAWSSNISPDKFLYFWSSDKKSLTAFYSASLPSGAKITWRLNPTAGAATNFRDLAGNELVAGAFSGDFTVAGGTNSNPGTTNSNTFCQTGSTNDPGLGSFTIFKFVNFIQTNAAPPVIDPSSGAMFDASITPHTNQTYTSANLTIPGGSSVALTNFFGSSYFFFQSFASQSVLESSFPNGTYTLRAQGGASGQATATLAFPASGYPPVPQVLNFPELQSMNPNADFTLRWNPFTAPGQYDSISLEVRDGSQNRVFFAPDYCLPRLLTNTATSIVIPAGTFNASGQFDGTLTFNRFGGGDTNSIPGSFGSSGMAMSTHFTFQVGATNQVAAPKWTDIHRNTDGSVSLQLTGSANKTYMIQASTDLSAWSTLLTTNSTSGSVTFRDATALSTRFRFFRAQMQ